MAQIIELGPEHCLGKMPKIVLDPFSPIAGGLIRSYLDGTQSPDIDVFPFSETAKFNFVHLNQLKDEKKLNPLTTEYKFIEEQPAISTTYKVQLIQLPNITTVEMLFDAFDYHVCQFATIDGIKVLTTPEALISVLRKRLSVNKFQDGHEYDSLRRAFKYHAKGYTLCPGTLKDIVLELRDIPAENLDQQLTISPNGGFWINRFD